jgi:hypothetical protein
MLDYLFKIKHIIEEYTCYAFIFNVTFDSDATIIFDYHVRKGFDFMFEGYHNLNACDIETNKESLRKIIRDIEDRCFTVNMDK